MKDLAKIRSDVIGSLLRPASLKEARVRFDEGTIPLEELRRLEDESICAAVKLQVVALSRGVGDDDLSH